MGLNDTPSGERVHIGFFGRRNAGKSSVVNAVTAQNLAIVSDQKGTTTDPVYKAMELLPLGPVMIIDTPGFDDEGKLGELRVRKAKQVLNKTDVAVLVVDAAEGLKDCDRDLIELFRAKNINYIVAMNKSDLVPGHPAPAPDEIYVSAETKDGVFELKERIAHLVPSDDMTKRLVGDLLSPGDTAIMVVPIDSAAPKGTAHPAPAAGHPGHAGGQRAGHGGQGGPGPGGHSRTGCKTRHGDNRQPGLQARIRRHAGGYPADLVFHPHGPLQGRAASVHRGRGRHRKPA
jgi:small GTP-binding protein